MPSRARIVFPGYPHHIVQRSDQHRNAFLDDEDRRTFIAFLAEASEPRLAIWAYALMPNHVHLIGVPSRRDAIGLAVERSFARYEEWFRAKYRPDGPLWKPRLYFSVLDRQAFLWKAVRYVERNPLRAGMVRRAEDYVWSSAAHHCGMRPDDPLIARDSPLRGAVRGWSGWLAEPDPWPRNDVRRETVGHVARAAD
jgi:putative transposase